jgi:HAD superfamily hydrolase (TIGR01509 family)
LRQINTTAQHLGFVAKEFGIELTGETLAQSERAFVTPEACGSVVLPNIQNVVKHLHERFRLGIISNTRSHILIEEIVKQIGLENYFAPLVTSVSAGYRKPSSVIFQAVLDTWNVPAHQVVMIGDSLSKDSAGAKALGMKTIWLKMDSPDLPNDEADAVAEMPEDILGVLQP